MDKITSRLMLFIINQNIRTMKTALAFIPSMSWCNTSIINRNVRLVMREFFVDHNIPQINKPAIVML